MNSESHSDPPQPPQLSDRASTASRLRKRNRHPSGSGRSAAFLFSGCQCGTDDTHIVGPQEQEATSRGARHADTYGTGATVGDKKDTVRLTMPSRQVGDSGRGTAAQLRRQIKEDGARSVAKLANAREDLKFQRQRDDLRERRKQQTQGRILARARSVPSLTATPATRKLPLESHLCCEGCRTSIRWRGEGVSRYYICEDCFSRKGMRVCLCPTCHDVKDLVHETDGSSHVFLDSFSFSSSSATSDEAVLLELPKIDFHQHCHHEDEVGLQDLLRVNAEWNVERSVLLALRPLIGSTREEVGRRNEWVLRVAARHPQIVPFVTIIEDDPMAPQMFSDCLDRGAMGLKLIGWHSSFIEKHDYDLRHAALMEVYRIASRRGVPILAHIYIGAGASRRDYVQDLDVILTTFPSLKFVLAHFGLGFDDFHWPLIEQMAEKHPNLYFDTSFYGGYKEVWFSRASSRSMALREFTLRFSSRILFGSDVFADSRTSGTLEYEQALRASTRFVQAGTFACLEFQRTDYFAFVEHDAFGPVVFDPLRLRGLDLASHHDQGEVLKRCFRENAVRLLNETEASSTRDNFVCT
eukprot:TRINITY_DN69765_c0_g1_i1.p1 TRINITY_DN69765_c0_g1~~TRINITY_DN69765_c0_g1_i1.p1  ORF type:complete len:602 (-),score=57.69 TRINITY_DN69765_c0_g1_i1:8-1750(-)